MTGETPRHAWENLAFGIITSLWDALPEPLAIASGAAVGSFVGSVLRVRRHDTHRHLAQAFPARSAGWCSRVARRSYTHLGREAVVLFRRGGWSAEQVLERTTVEGFDAFAEAARTGKGLVLLTGHLGNWEIGGAAIAARGIPLDVVGKGMANRRFEEDLFAARERLGMRVIEMRDASREALRSLAAGRVVALLGDHSARSGGIFLPFFGRPASTVRGPALFAARSGAPVWVAFCVRDPGGLQRYTVSFEPLPFVPTGRSDEDVTALMSAYARRLEEAVRAAPEQYFWQHRRWKRRPPEEQASDR